MLIGLCGYAGSGKDTIADVLCTATPAATTASSPLPFERIAFADALRSYARHINPRVTDTETYTQLVDRLGYEAAKRQYPELRDLLVRIGHGARVCISDTIWIDAATRRLDSSDEWKTANVVVTDVRYRNEAAAIRARGGEIWYVYRPGVEGEPLERDTMKLIQFDYVITNNGTLEQLAEQVRAMVKS